MTRDVLFAACGEHGVVAKMLIGASNVLVHCSDGWDRTSQLVALAQVLMDPFYRTIDGLRVLIEKDWLHFGHPFAARSNSSLVSTSLQPVGSPIFLLFLMCLNHLIHLSPECYEYNPPLLWCIAKVSMGYGVFGDLLCDSEVDRERHGIRSKTMSMWAWIQQHRLWFISSEFKRSQWRKPMSPLLDDQGHVSLWQELYHPPPSYNALMRALMHPTPSYPFARPPMDHISFDITSSTFRLAHALVRHKRTRLLHQVLNRWKQRSDWDQDMHMSSVVSINSSHTIGKSVSMEDISRGWIDVSVQIQVEDEHQVHVQRELGKALGPELVIYQTCSREFCISYDEDAFSPTSRVN